MINAKKSKLTNIKKTCPLAENNLPEAGLRVAMKRQGKNDDRRYNRNDIETGKKVLQNKNIKKVTQKVWKSHVYRRPKILGIPKDRSPGNVPQSDALPNK